MAITVLNGYDAGSEASLHQASKSKIIFVALMFVISLTTFVSQTEFTSQVYQLGFKEPVILLLVTHGSWWILWPFQAFLVSFIRTLNRIKQGKVEHKTNSHNLGDEIHNLRSSSQTPLLDAAVIPLQGTNYWIYFKKCIVKQFHNVYHTAILIYESEVNDDKSTNHFNHLIDRNPHVSSSSSVIACIKTFFESPAIKYIYFKTFLVTLVLTVAGFTWYGAMSMTYAADVTAIYNCSAFTAYAFAIPILNEKFSWLKVTSVVIAISGVGIVAYSEPASGNNANEPVVYPYRFWGNLIIFLGAILYGYYEVLYKRYLCIPPHIATKITPRRQLTFANFVMALIGSATCIILLTGITIVHVTGIHKFNVFGYDNAGTIWLYILGSMVSNLTFSASFLTLMALTSPVLSSVSSLLTIFLTGLVEWYLFGNKLSGQQLLGDLFVIVGFVILTVASWNEISEGNEEDDVENVSTYSFALSYDG